MDFSSQITTPYWNGLIGQEKLASSSVLIVGAGALGCATASQLTGAGVGKITIYDDDVVEAKNLHRQFLYNQKDIGFAKVDRLVQALMLRNSKVNLKGVQAQISAKNIRSAAEGVDLILDCTDNFPSRYLISDFSQETNKPVISASVTGWNGMLANYTEAYCLRCVYPDYDPTFVQNCKSNGVFEGMVGILGSFQSVEAIKYILQIPSKLNQCVGFFDGIDVLLNTIAPDRSKCPFHCSIEQGKAQKKQPDAPAPKKAADSKPTKHCKLEDADKPLYTILDLRIEKDKPLPLKFAKSLDIEISEIKKLLQSNLNKEYFAVCDMGVKSKELVKILRSQGHLNIRNISQ